MSEYAKVRIGDVERSNAVEQLEQHAAAGRLSPDELEHRRSLAQAATYESDLEPLFSDLPGGFMPPPQPTWQTWRPEPSGVSDGPGDHRPYADPADNQQPSSPDPGPVLTGEVYDEYVEVTRRSTMRPMPPRSSSRAIWRVLTFLISVAVLWGIWKSREYWLFIFCFPFIFPLSGGHRRH